jgi:Trk-type K+ transport system membrane component
MRFYSPVFLPIKLTDGRFSLFQAVSAYTNTGTSLVDQSMLPFQQAYPTILVLIFLILAGNTCFVRLCSPSNGVFTNAPIADIVGQVMEHG